MNPTLKQTDKEGFGGLTVAAFESRMAKEMEELITRHGGLPKVAPSMREIPLSGNKPAFEFFEKLKSGLFDILILTTGVGTRTLLEAVGEKYPKSQVEKAFKHCMLVARSSKPAKALSEHGFKASLTVPEPNTWREVLETLGDLKGRRVAVQEYGVSNPELLEGLRKQGAKEVLGFPVYRWELPSDTAPLTQLIGSMARGEAAVALFTSGQQILNVLQLAKKLGQEEALKQAFSRMVVASIGGVCSESLRECGIAVDLEPEHPKMGFLVKEAAEKSLDLRQKKTSASIKVSPAPSRPEAKTLAKEDLSGVAPSRTEDKSPFPAWKDSLFLKACRCEPTPRTPLWIMRQAGRYLPEYRRVRARVPFLELCKTPELAAEVTVTAQQALGVDAAILFSDILVIAEPLGFKLEYLENGGPVIHNPFRSGADLTRLEQVEASFDLSYVNQAIRLIRSELKPHIPLIGFAGAPFTLASYLIEGGGSKDYFHTRSVMTDIKLWDLLMKRLVSSTVSYLNAQIKAGVQAVQLFDSWVGILAPEEFQRLVLPYLKQLIGSLKPGIPVIYFGTQTSPFFPWLKETGATVVGVDWRVELDKAWKQLGNVAIQGNLNPEILLTDTDTVCRETEKVLRLAGGRPGHIFNLGHGILPQTPMDNVRAMIETVKNSKNPYPD